MNITVISTSWPSNEHSGVSLAAHNHVEILLENDISVSIIGAFSAVINCTLPLTHKLCIPSSGSGSLYSPSRVNTATIKEALKLTKPYLVIVEAWQTALTDHAIDAAHSMNIPVMMVSHGISVHPYSGFIKDRLRALAWSFYRLYKLPALISKLNLLTTLNLNVSSTRFYDRDLANSLGIPTTTLVNCPINWATTYKSKASRKLQILVIGYFSPIKNQLAAIDLLSRLPNEISMMLIGPKEGGYFARCVRMVQKLGLNNRIIFCSDNECDLAHQIATSMVVFSPSLTEVLPITILEAMASGTPFVASPVGAIPSLGVGIVSDDPFIQAQGICKLVLDDDFWSSHSISGMEQYKLRFTRNHVATSLLQAINIATRRSN